MSPTVTFACNYDNVFNACSSCDITGGLTCWTHILTFIFANLIFSSICSSSYVCLWEGIAYNVAKALTSVFCLGEICTPIMPIAFILTTILWEKINLYNRYQDRKNHEYAWNYFVPISTYNHIYGNDYRSISTPEMSSNKYRGSLCI